MEGWIKLHRQLLESDLWTCEPFSRGQAWIDLLLLANHKDSFFYKRGNKINVKRGQLGRSSVELSSRWTWSRSKVNKFLKDLEKEQQILITKTSITQLVTIINYEFFQSKEQQTEQQKSSRRAAEEQQKDTYKNDNNDNNEKKYYAEFSEKFYSELDKRNLIAKNQNPKNKSWTDPVRLLVEKDGVEMEKVKAAANFYFTYLEDPYCPEIRSTKTLREKYQKLIDYSRRLEHASSSKGI